MNPDRAAERGAKLLDDFLPRWAEIVDTARLSLDDCHRCVLGQLFGEYELGANWLERVLGRQRPTFYGFDVDYKLHLNTDEAEDDYYDRLDQAWTDEVRKRVPADSNSADRGRG